MSNAAADHPDAAVIVTAAANQAAVKEAHTGELSLTTTNAPAAAFALTNAAERLSK